jgi:hypothetical protein
LLAATIFATLAGCGTVGTVRFEMDASASSPPALRDERPPSDRKSSWARSYAGELTTLGDDSVSPSAPVLFLNRVGVKLGDKLAKHEVVLARFSIQVLDPSRANANRTIRQAREEGVHPLHLTVIGTYARTVEPIRSEEIVDVHISGKIGGVDFSISEYRKFPGRVTEEEIRSVVLKAIDRAAESMEEAVSGNTKLRVQPLHER